MAVHLDGAWDTFLEKSLNGTFTLDQKKAFGPTFFSNSMQWLKMPFFRKGWDGCALFVQPSKSTHSI